MGNAHQPWNKLVGDYKLRKFESESIRRKVCVEISEMLRIKVSDVEKSFRRGKT